MSVAGNFLVASIIMLVAPIVVLYSFNLGLFPGLTQLSSESRTLISGILAVVSVNIVIAFYIYTAMKEPSGRHVPDPAFLAKAKASVEQLPNADKTETYQDRDKEE
ncbi:hypothetical protein ACHQM5_015522 [Ranunculus cassubicifolius]